MGPSTMIDRVTLFRSRCSILKTRSTSACLEVTVPLKQRIASAQHACINSLSRRASQQQHRIASTSRIHSLVSKTKHPMQPLNHQHHHIRASETPTFPAQVTTALTPCSSKTDTLPPHTRPHRRACSSPRASFSSPSTAPAPRPPRPQRA